MTYHTKLSYRRNISIVLVKCHLCSMQLIGVLLLCNTCASSNKFVCPSFFPCPYGIQLWKHSSGGSHLSQVCCIHQGLTCPALSRCCHSRILYSLIVSIVYSYIGSGSSLASIHC